MNSKKLIKKKNILFSTKSQIFQLFCLFHWLGMRETACDIIKKNELLLSIIIEDSLIEENDLNDVSVSFILK